MLYKKKTKKKKKVDLISSRRLFIYALPLTYPNVHVFFNKEEVVHEKDSIKNYVCFFYLFLEDFQVRRSF